MIQTCIRITMSVMDISMTVYHDLGTKVYETLKEMIVRGELQPGQKLIQEELAQALGVSRTPLLQAISKLTKDHYLVTVPRRGSFVRRYSPEEFLHMFDIRGQLEPMGAYHAAERATEEDLAHLKKLLDGMSEYVNKGQKVDVAKFFAYDYAFHMAIMKISGNQFLYDILKNLNNILANSENLLKTPQKSVEEHHGIYNAMQSHDANGAKELMFYHVNGGSRTRLAQRLQEEE